MGMVACGRHGHQTGPLACGHIGDDAHGIPGSTRVPPQSVLRLDLDVMEDGSDLLEHSFCRACAEKYGLANLKTIPHDIWGSDDRFPYVAPVCELCFSDWSRGPPATE